MSKRFIITIFSTICLLIPIAIAIITNKLSGSEITLSLGVLASPSLGYLGNRALSDPKTTVNQTISSSNQ